MFLMRRGMQFFVDALNQTFEWEFSFGRIMEPQRFLNDAVGFINRWQEWNLDAGALI